MDQRKNRNVSERGQLYREATVLCAIISIVATFSCFLGLSSDFAAYLALGFGALTIYFTWQFHRVAGPVRFSLRGLMITITLFAIAFGIMMAV